MKTKDEVIKALNRTDIEIEKIKLKIYEKSCKAHEFKALEDDYKILNIQKGVLEWILNEDDSLTQ